MQNHKQTLSLAAERRCMRSQTQSQPRMRYAIVVVLFSSFFILFTLYFGFHCFSRTFSPLFCAGFVHGALYVLGGSFTAKI